MSRHAWWLPALVAGAVALAIVLPATARLQARATVQDIATGLFNPRGLNFGPDGALYVAEAGSGSAGDATAPSLVSSDTFTKYYGNTGAVTKIVLGGGPPSRIVSGLPSIAPLNGAGATGPHDVDFQGLGNGFVTIGLGADPESRVGRLLGNLGHLIRFTPNGKWTYEEDLAGFEDVANPDGLLPDSNPYGLLALPGRQVFTDAGGNSLNAVAANGSISNLAVFPNHAPPGPPFQAVPTCVALGADGYLYVGQLTGGPFPAGAASVYRVPANGGTPEFFAGGFTKIIDIAFAPDGSLYVLEISAAGGGPPAGGPGALIHVTTDPLTQAKTLTTILAPGDGLIAPGGIAIARDGSIYITNHSIEPGGIGTVVKVIP
jgi:hypothetical protein